MTGDQVGQLVYLVLLAGAVGGYFLAHNRKSLGKLAQQATLWGLIFIGVIAGAGLWSDIRQQVMPRQTVFAEEGRVELPRAPDGHFYVTIVVNGAPVRFVVDTGATDVVLTEADAKRAGIDLGALRFTGEARTANGLVQTARVRLDQVALGGMVDDNVRAFVNGGEMDISLLGMAYLQRFEKMEITRDQMVLSR